MAHLLGRRRDCWEKARRAFVEQFWEPYSRARNLTAEEEPSVRQYMLRVPPGVRSARQAIAWTFGETEGSYRPRLQT